MWQAAAVRQILAAAAIAGILTGLLLTAVQQLTVVPLLREAEVYEQAALSNAALAAPPRQEDAHHAASQEHDSDLKRAFLSAASNVTLAFGLALLLGAAMHLSAAKPGLRSGVLWGIAGYLAFFLAPSLGLPPELPGTASAGLANRQIWWLFAALSTASGIALLVYGRSGIVRVLGLVIIVLPHLVGAPQPEVHASSAPEALTRVFAWTAAGINLISWVSLGALYGYVLERQLARDGSAPA